MRSKWWKRRLGGEWHRKLSCAYRWRPQLYILVRCYHLVHRHGGVTAMNTNPQKLWVGGWEKSILAYCPLKCQDMPGIIMDPGVHSLNEMQPLSSERWSRTYRLPPKRPYFIYPPITSTPTNPPTQHACSPLLRPVPGQAGPFIPSTNVHPQMHCWRPWLII